MAFHSGFVCILGRPNAGKSTLLNALVGERLAIISPKPQTTRNRIQGILHIPKQGKRSGAQVVLIDTPGVHKPDTSLGRKMMHEVREAIEGCDLILLVIDITRRLSHEDQAAIQMAQQAGTPVFLLPNKIDLLKDKKKLLPIIDEYQRLHAFQEIIPLSALKKDGLQVLLEKIVNALPPGPKYFSEDQITDQPIRFMAAEIIREHGGTPVRTRVGHSFIKQVMAETGAIFGGEHSAHYYFRDNWRADSGSIAALMVLEQLSRAKVPLSTLRKPFDRYADSGEINTTVDDPAAVIEKVAAAFSGAGQDRLDGLTVDLGDWWFNLRPSNTEPLLRLNLEAADRAACDAHTAEVLALIGGSA